MFTQFFRNLFFATLIFFPLGIVKESFAANAPGFETELVAGGFVLPTAVVTTPDGRIFVAEKAGTVRVIKNGSVLPNPLLTLTDVNNYGDRGLIGMTIDPNFSTNGYIYVGYTYENTPGINYAGPKTSRVVRFTVVGDSVVAGSQLVIIGSVGGTVGTPSCNDYPITADCVPSDAISHSIGALHFGPDGKLYITTGDGASFDYADPLSLRAQNLDSLAGKVLRVNPDGTAPNDNPFFTGDPNANKSKIWAYGLRNMFRFSFKPGTNVIFGGDVGWSTWEEVNLVTPGANLGWPCNEGNGPTPLGLGCTATGAINPLYTYHHDASGAGSVVGGVFFSSSYPAEFANSYVYGDYAINTLTKMNLAADNSILSQENLIDNPEGPVDIEMGNDGNIYFLSIYTGNLYKLKYTLGNRQPIAVMTANPTAGTLPLTVQFSATGSSDPDGDPLTYTWNFADGTSGTGGTISHTFSTGGVYNVSVTVSDGRGGVATKSLDITAGNQKPTATIIAPTNGYRYTVGELIRFEGSGVDPETGTLPLGAIRWNFILHHNIHVHYLDVLTGSVVTLVAPDHQDTDVYLEVQMTVTDPAGLTDTKSINLYLNNAGSATGNLLMNPSLELATTVPDMPDSWIKGWWGTLNPTFTYPTVGIHGEKGARVDITSYTDGDAKWAPSPVSVTAGKTYNFQNQYRSNVQTEFYVAVGYANGTYTYAPFYAPPTNNWAYFSGSYTIPTGGITAALYHSISRVGWIETDNYFLGESLPDGYIPPIGKDNSITVAFGTGLITLNNILANDLVFATGTTLLPASIDLNPLISEPQNILVSAAGTWTANTLNGDVTFAPISNFSGITSIPYSVKDSRGNSTTANLIVNIVASTPPPSNVVNLITNSGVEISGGTTPTGWNIGGYGTNNRTFTYLSTGALREQKSIKVDITSYTDGDGKWYFNDIPVTTGAVYNYSQEYISSVPTSLFARFLLSNNTYQYQFLKTVPANNSLVPLTFTASITPPANAVSFTIWNSLSSIGSLTLDTFSLSTPNNSNTGGSQDTTPPTVVITSPNDAGFYTGTILLGVNATDNVAIASVDFYIDGVLVGSDTTNPYSLSLTASSMTGGVHVYTAKAKDTSNNSTTSAERYFFSSNKKAPPPVVIWSEGFESGTIAPPWNTPNQNFSLTPGTCRSGPDSNTKALRVTGTVPQDGVGLNRSISMAGFTGITLSFCYKWDSLEGTDGIDVEYSINSGATWRTAKTINNAGTVHMFYTADDSKIAVPSGNLIPNPVSISQDNLAAYYLELPSDVANATGFRLRIRDHMTDADDYVWIDDFRLMGTPIGLTDTTPPNITLTQPLSGATLSGTITLSATGSDNVGIVGVQFQLDGANIGAEDTTVPYTISYNSALALNGSHTFRAIARDAAGNSRTSSGVTVLFSNIVSGTGAELITNGGMETSNGSTPAGWFTGGYGTNTRIFSYISTGALTGTKSVKTDITAYTSGDAKWYFNDVAVTPGKIYTYSQKYSSNVTSSLYIRYKLSTGAYQYVLLRSLPIANIPTTISSDFTVPANVTSVTLWISLTSVGSYVLDDVSLKLK